MNNINSFSFYKDYFDLLDNVSLEDKKTLSVSILDYMFKDVEPNLEGLNKAIFNNLKRALDKSKNKANNAQKDGFAEIKVKSKQNQMKIKKKSNGVTHQDVNVNVNSNMLDVNSNIIKEIIDYLNNKLNTKYDHKTKTTKACINARLKENYTVNDFKKVIDKKYNEWNNTDMEKYLRPDTLFGTKFDTYLNQPEVKRKKTVDEIWDEMEG